MTTDVLMPQMGESITEGTITKWLKKPGDRVEKDEPLFEISTDKVDAEISAAIAGWLSEIKFAEGETVAVNSVVAVLADSAGASSLPASELPADADPDTLSSAEATGTAQVSRDGSQFSGGVPVVMPQMGESITEGTITKWLKKPGDRVEKDEPLFEISTDKVDAEIPSPAAGMLGAIHFAEGATVPVNAVVAAIGEQLSAPARKPQSWSAPSEDAAPAKGADAAPGAAASGQHTRSSPLARRVARERQIDPAEVPPSGLSGRVLKDDVLRYAQRETRLPQQQAPQLRDEIVPLSRMRAIIAQRMVESSQQLPHVHTVYRVDMTRIVRIREAAKAGFERQHGTKLTYLPFIATAVVHALRLHPILNATLIDGAIHYSASMNLGIAVALDWGLIVPVVQGADQLGFAGLASKISDLAARARSRKLNPEEVAGSTFTITNSGIFGDELTTPIINQPNSAILCVSGLKKEAVVRTAADGTDTIAIRSMQSLTLGFDHRLIDGADACKFMLDVKAHLEQWDTGIYQA